MPFTEFRSSQCRVAVGFAKRGDAQVCLRGSAKHFLSLGKDFLADFGITKEDFLVVALSGEVPGVLAPGLGPVALCVGLIGRFERPEAPVPKRPVHPANGHGGKYNGQEGDQNQHLATHDRYISLVATTATWKTELTPYPSASARRGCSAFLCHTKNISSSTGISTDDPVIGSSCHRH